MFDVLENVDAEPHYSLGSWKPLFLLEIRILLVSWAFESLLIATAKRRVEREGENKRESESQIKSKERVKVEAWTQISRLRLTTTFV